MANQKGNIYPVWYLSNQGQVIARDSSGAPFPMSDLGFAEDIGISEDGTLWVISTESDEDGGNLIYWCEGDGNWQKIANGAPGGASITGTGPGFCLYLSLDGKVYSMNTAGEYKLIFGDWPIQFIDYGAGFLWALFAVQPGDEATLNYTSFGESPLAWKAFPNAPQPENFSVDMNGNCNAVLDFTPITYSSDGSSTYSPGAGANGIAMQITCKSWMYLVTTKGYENGNEVYIWQDEQGGQFIDAGFAAAKVLSSYYLTPS